MPTPIPMLWSILPPEAQRPMVALWSDLLRRRLTGRMARKETPHDPFAQDRTSPSAAAGDRLHSSVDTKAGAEQPGKYPASVPVGRACQQMGWAASQIRVIDEDLGLSGASSRQRTGFQSLVAAIGLGEVGIILVTEVSRLSRCNSDWHRVIELCGVFRTLIADEDGVYDARDPNDLLLLGVKGTLFARTAHPARSHAGQPAEQGTPGRTRSPFAGRLPSATRWGCGAGPG